MARGKPGAKSSWTDVARSVLLALTVVAILALGYEQGWLGAGSGGGSLPVEPGQRVSGEITRVVDGDTVIIEIDGHDERLRYIGIDAPESATPDQPVECYGPQASAFNARMVAGRTVDLVIGEEVRDPYGRLLGYVWVGDFLVNAELVRSGFATALTIPPNDRYAEQLDRLEHAARRAGIGKWTACD